MAGGAKRLASKKQEREELLQCIIFGENLKNQRKYYFGCKKEEKVRAIFFDG